MISKSAAKREIEELTLDAKQIKSTANVHTDVADSKVECSEAGTCKGQWPTFAGTCLRAQ